MEVLFKRTEKGEDALAKRVYGLSQECRWVLILVDNKTYVSDILNKCSTQWKPLKTLRLLEQEGFIYNSDTSVKLTPASVLIQQKIVSAIKKKIPAGNEKVVKKIQNSELTKDALAKSIDSACMFVKLTISQDIAKELKVELHKILNNQ